MKQLTIIGNIGYDAVIKEYQGSKFVQFTVAVNERFKDSQNQSVERTEWISCTSRHYNLAQYLKKGKKVLCQGNMKVTVYRGRDGVHKAGINLHVTHVEFLGGPRAREDGAVSDQEKQSLSGAARDGEMQYNTENVPDDLPF